MATHTNSADNRWNKGNVTDRRNRRMKMLKWWGDGETCKCVWCGRVVTENPGDGSGEAPEDHISVDHIICHADGGRYIVQNLVPTCQRCNKSRGRKSFDEFAASKGINPEPLKAHAAATPRRMPKA